MQRGDEAGFAALPTEERSVQLPQSVRSALTGRESPLILTIPSRRLVDGYQQRYGYDAAHCFKDVPLVGLHRCDTGFRFYYPFSVAGDESLYRRHQVWTS